jgi:hypothetical protein
MTARAATTTIAHAGKAMREARVEQTTHADRAAMTVVHAKSAPDALAMVGTTRHAPIGKPGLSVHAIQSAPRAQ